MTIIKPTFTHAFLMANVLLIAVALRAYFRLDATLLVGLATLPSVLLVSEKRANWSVFWLFPLVIGAFLTPSYTLLYLSIIGTMVWFIGQHIGKLSILPILLSLTISPIFSYVTDVFSFDLRLKITDLAVHILNKIPFSGVQMAPSVSTTSPTLFSENSSNSIVSNPIQAVGNLIRLPNGDEWQIDAACMGLNMLGVGLILTYFFIGFFAKKSTKLPTNRGLFVFLLAALCLNLVSNLTRIVAVVLLNIRPETVGHEVVGLLSFLIYGIAPMYFLIKMRTRSTFFFDEKIKGNAFQNPPKFSKTRVFIVPIIVLGLLASRAIYLDFYKKMPQNVILSTKIQANFTISHLPDGVTQLKSNSILIYLKNLSHGFTTEHSPMICWKGSGYTFRQIERTTIDQTPIYIGILERDSDQIHAAWWFESDNGFATNDQFEWRYRVFTEGGHFRLVNVNAASREQVLAASKRWLEKH